MGPHGSWPDFPVVIKNLQEQLMALGHTGVTVFYCCGYDHFMKCGLQGGLNVAAEGSLPSGLVVLPRDGKNACGKHKAGGLIVSVKPDDAPSQVSSTEIRRAIAEGLSTTGLLHPEVEQ